MKKLLSLILLLVAISYSEIIFLPTFIPDLDHENAIQWNIDLEAALQEATARGEELISANLYVADLMNIFEPEIDALYINILDIVHLINTFSWE